MERPLWMWVGFFSIVFVLLIFDLGLIHHQTIQLILTQIDIGIVWIVRRKFISRLGHLIPA